MNGHRSKFPFSSRLFVCLFMFEEKKKFDRMYHDDVLLMICICVEDKWHLSNGLTYASTLVADLFSHCDSFLTYLIR